MMPSIGRPLQPDLLHRLILADGGRSGPQMRIWLNVSTEDVTLALDSVEKDA